jgi:hypothetical protein
MIFDGFVHQVPDIDPGETGEWLDSLDAVVDAHGKARARFLVAKLLERARALQVGFPATVSTPYMNTIPPEEQAWFPGDEHLERRIRAFIRWNAAVMVVRANKRAEGIGGHLATFASSAALYEVGFNHFFKGKDDGLAGDQVFFQGHGAPASTPAPTSRAASPRTSSTASARRSGAVACRATRTRASCPTSGSSRRSPWASARSTPSTRPASTATCRTAASPTPPQHRVVLPR